ncbi:MAG: hypothetical protein MJY63_05710, partial [Paludibacteraceae bacterium]|nr:hypothetical protein [Paludibacteraceae bacterium]
SRKRVQKYSVFRSCASVSGIIFEKCLQIADYTRNKFFTKTVGLRTTANNLPPLRGFFINTTQG